MPNPLKRPQSEPLRLVAVMLSLPELYTVAQLPGVIDTYRLTQQFHDGRQPNQIATLIRRQGKPGASLSVSYWRPGEKPLVMEYALEQARYEALASALRKQSFDNMDDMPDLPWLNADLWMLERAAAGFYHDVILAPATAQGAYLALIETIQLQLKEAVRQVYINTKDGMG
jgi:hypothetical protein